MIPRTDTTPLQTVFSPNFSTTATTSRKDALLLGCGTHPTPRYPAAAMIPRKEADLREAPPTRAPSISVSAIRVAALSGVTLPP